MDRAARTRSLPWAEVVTASLIFLDSSSELNSEATYSTEPSDAFTNSPPSSAGYNIIKDKCKLLTRKTNKMYKEK